MKDRHVTRYINKKTNCNLVSFYNFPKASNSQKAEVCNGAGPGKIGGLLVPDTIWGLCITEAANIHDWCYLWGETSEDRKLADNVFHENMIRMIDGTKSWRWLKRLRRNRAWIYYMAVHKFGKAFFYDKKGVSFKYSDVG